MRRSHLLIALGIVVLCLAQGCNTGGKMRPVSGRIEFPAGQVSELKGHLLELVLIEENSQRASGVIDETGRFTLETLDHGERRPGVKPGKYRARIVIVDEGDGQTKKPVLPKQYLHSETSGWSVEVPAAVEIVLTIGR